MNILYIITRSDTVGGAHVHLMELAANAKNNGHAVTILIGGRGTFYEQLIKKGLHVISMRYMRRSINPISDIFSFFECLFYIKKIKPDIIHLHSTKAGVLGRLAARVLKIPSVYTAHGWAFTEGVSIFRRKIAILSERLVSKFCHSIIICVSDYDLCLAKSLNVADSKKLLLIHNGMPDVRCPLTRDDKEEKSIRLIIIARLASPKLHETLFLALSKIACENWSLEVVGDGPNMPSLVMLAHQLGLSGKIMFRGNCNDVAQRLADADIFILISAWEGLPLSIIEAMRAGLPIIASHVGGIVELIDDGEGGYLIPRGNTEYLADRIEFLIKNKLICRKMGLVSRKKYENQFRFESMYNKTVEVYERAVNL